MLFHSLHHLLDMGHCTIVPMGHSKGSNPPTLDIAPLEDVRFWLDGISLDDGGTPLWRGYGSPFHDDVVLGG